MRQGGDLYRFRQRRGERRSLERACARAADQQAHLGRRIQLEAQRLNLVAQGMAVEGEAEHRRARLHPRKVVFEQRDPGVGFEAHRLDQIALRGCKPRRQAAQEARFDLALAAFRHWIAVGHDRRADPEHRRALPVLDGGEPKRADRDVEGGVAVSIDPPDRPAIGPARIALHLREQLHRPDLGRAGDRAAGEQRAHQVHRALARAEPRAHGRDHLVHGRIGLDREGRIDMDRAGLGHARQVVPHQVDDHQVLGAVLHGRGQLLHRRAVRFRVGRAGAGALHRLDLGLAARERHEQLGREAQQPVRTIEDQPAIARRRRAAQGGIEPHRIAPVGACERVGEVCLIDVARADRLDQRRERRAVAAGRELRLHRAERAGAIGARFQPGEHTGCGDPGGGVEQPEPHQRACRPAARRCVSHQLGLEREPRLIGNGACERAALLEPRCLGGGQHRFDLAGPVRHEQRARALVEQRVGSAFPGAGVIEQDEWRWRSHHAARLGPTARRCRALPAPRRRVGDT